MLIDVVDFSWDEININFFFLFISFFCGICDLFIEYINMGKGY